METNAVRVGDQIRFSTALLAQIHESPDHHSQLCRVDRIDRDEDGCLLILLTHVREPYVSPGNGDVN